MKTTHFPKGDFFDAFPPHIFPQRFFVGIVALQLRDRVSELQLGGIVNFYKCFASQDASELPALVSSRLCQRLRVLVLRIRGRAFRIRVRAL